MAIKKADFWLILMRPAMIAFYLWIIIIIFVPNYFQKYKAEIREIATLRETTKLYFHDLDSDGLSEKLNVIYSDSDLYPALVFLDEKERVINQWNLRGKWILRQKIFFGDYDSNGFTEVYCITRLKDSLFLNIKELPWESGLTVDNRFICKTNLFKDNQVDVGIVDGRMIDINQDNKYEFVFTLTSGLSKSPRNFYSYYIDDDSLVSSPKSAAHIYGQLDYLDLNGDGVEEITGFIAGTNNIHKEMDYTDSVSWLMVINPANEMDFLFPPIRFNKIFSTTRSFFYSVNDKKYIASTFYSSSSDDDFDGYWLKLFDESGNLLKTKAIHNNEYKNLTFVKQSFRMNNTFTLIDEMGNFYKSDSNLNIELIKKSEIEDLTISTSYGRVFDLDRDGKNEFIFVTKGITSDRLIIYRANLLEYTQLYLPESKLTSYWHITTKQTSLTDSPSFIVQANNIAYSVDYYKSEYYLLKYPVYILIYFLLYAIFWILQLGQNKLAERRYETEKKLMKQQLALSKRQLEPHFMLNTLNNIAYMFSQENKDDAQFYFGSFTSLIHRSLKYADQIETTMYEELEFVRDYLVLQKNRFNDKLEFRIEAEDDIKLKSIKIPHSLIFTFAENAVKHGLMHKIGNRQLDIFISEKQNKIEVNIIDNGIGRQQSLKLKTSGTKKGLSIVDNIIEGYNNLYNQSISYKVIDLVDEFENALGTEVKLLL